jgi:hypothetical protein
MGDTPPRAVDSPMWQATRALHHACEMHPVGAAMSNGTISAAWWNAWLCVLADLHAQLDPHLPSPLRRVDQLAEDLMAMNERGHKRFKSWHAGVFAQRLQRAHATDIAGAAYVLTGAHLMGGAVTERAVGARLPCAHLRWEDRAAAREAWAPYRWREDSTESAVRVFRSLLFSMGEIAAVVPDGR